MRRLALLLLVLAPSIPRPTGACSPVPENDGPHMRDVAFANDVVPPSEVTATASVYRDTGGGGGGGCGTVDCGGSGSHVYLGVSATDDRASTDRIGYQFAIAGGEPPAGLTLPTGPVLSAYGDVMLRFYSNAGEFNFALEIRAVDLNGNLGPATVIVVSSEA